MKLAKVNWLNHFLEFLVVLIGILLAFQLNKCSIENSQDKIIKTHLIHIRQETEFNLDRIDGSIFLAETNLHKLDTLLQLINSKKDFQKINRISFDLLNIGSLFFKKNAYTSLIETGDIRFIRDLNKKQDIIGLYEYYKWVDSFEKLLANDYSNDYYPYLKENFDILNNKVQDETIYTSLKFQNILSAYKYHLGNKLKKYKDCKAEMEK